MKARKPQPAPAPPDPPAPVYAPREEWPPLVMRDKPLVQVRPLISQLVEDYELHLPPYQRGVVWTGEQQRAFCADVFAGFGIQAMLFWAMPSPFGGNARCYVLDGQQRLTALGVPLRRADGTMNPLPASFLDLETGTWKEEPTEHPSIVQPLTAANVACFHPCIDPNVFDRRIGKLLHVGRNRLYRDIQIFVLEANTTPEVAVEAFRRWNRPGTPFAEEQIEALISECGLTRS